MHSLVIPTLLAVYAAFIHAVPYLPEPGVMGNRWYPFAYAFLNRLAGNSKFLNKEK